MVSLYHQGNWGRKKNADQATSHQFRLNPLKTGASRAKKKRTKLQVTSTKNRTLKSSTKRKFPRPVALGKKNTRKGQETPAGG